MPLNVPLVNTFEPFNQGIGQLQNALRAAPQQQMEQLQLGQAKRAVGEQALHDRQNQQIVQAVSGIPDIAKRHEVAASLLESFGRFDEAQKIKDVDLQAISALKDINPELYAQKIGEHYGYGAVPLTKRTLTTVPESASLVDTTDANKPKVIMAGTPKLTDYEKRYQDAKKTEPDLTMAQFDAQQKALPGPPAAAPQLGAEDQLAITALETKLQRQLTPEEKVKAIQDFKKDPEMQNLMKEAYRTRADMNEAFARFLPYRNVQSVADPISGTPKVVTAETAVKTGATPAKIGDINTLVSKGGLLQNLAFDIKTVKEQAQNLVNNRGKIGIALKAPGGLTDDFIQGLAQGGMDENTLKGLYALKRLQEGILSTKGLMGNTPIGSDPRVRVMLEQVPGRSAILSGNTQSLLTGLNEFQKAFGTIVRPQRNILKLAGIDIPPEFDEQPNTEGAFSVTAPNGKIYTFPDQKSANQFKANLPK